MILRSSGPSPFGRKVKIAAKMLGLYDQLTIEMGDTNNPADTLRQQNPLGKIPVLILEDGRKLYDSRVICEYLDVLAGNNALYPASGTARWDALTLQALGDGIIDAAILQVYEIRMRPEEKRHADWVDYQAGKVARSLDHLAANPPAIDGNLTIGHVAIACALGYLDLRFAGKWRETHSSLIGWLDAFRARVPAFDATRFDG